MKDILPLIYSILFALLVSSCTQSVSLADISQKKSELLKGLFVPVLAPASLGREVVLTQTAEIKFNSKTYELLLVSEISRKSISIVGLLPSGVRIFSIVYDGTDIHIDGADKLVESMPPEMLLVDMQLTLWPLETLQREYALENYSLVDKKAGTERVLNYKGQDKITINYSSESRFLGDINYNHLERGYSIHLTTLEFQEVGDE